VKLPSRKQLARLLPSGPVGWRDHAVGAAVGFVYVVWLLAGARAIGFPRDEGVYFRAATSYVGWWRMLLERGQDALQQGAIDSAFSDNHEHPTLMKTLFGISWWFLHEKWRVFSDASTAYRFPAMCAAGGALWIVYVFGARAWSRRAGLVAAVLLGLMPRVFFHSHLACFDVPITTMWILCVYAAWRAADTKKLGWAIATGILFGLALETKHNAWMLPGVIGIHALFVQRRALVEGLKVGRVSIPATLVTMLVFGPIVFLALWPYLWNDTLARIEWYVDFHLNHEYYNIEYLHRNYFGPPSPKSYLPVMVLATVPTVTLLLFFVGVFDRCAVTWGRLRESARGLLRPSPTATAPAGTSADPGELDLLLALSFLVPVAFFFLPKTPIFGGTKHWMPAYPALALLAGRGFELVSGAMRRAWPELDGGRRFAAEGALFASVTLAPLAVTAHAQPFGLSSYVPLVGGTAGGADLGLNRQFWGFTTQDAAEEYLNAKAPNGTPVFISDTTWDAWGHMQQEGRVRHDLRATGTPHDSHIALVQHELHMNEVDYSIWVAYGTDAPAYVVLDDGVPIVSIYRRP
jgi:hypothetical protein